MTSKLLAALEVSLLYGAWYTRNRGSRMAWEYSPAQQCFQEMSGNWDAINRGSHDHVLLDSRFVGPSLRWLDGDDVLLGADTNSSCRGMALVKRTGPGRWETFQPSQAPLGFVIVDKSIEPQDALFRLLSSLPGLALQLGVLQQDPDYSSFGALTDGPQVKLLEYIRTPSLTLPGTYEEYWSKRSGNLRHNLSRQQKRLAEKGRKLELVVRKAHSEMAAAIREYGRLESVGWKGREGTAVTEGNAQGRFYREVLEAFSATGEALVYQLFLDGKIIASDLCLARRGMLVVLKTAYDETIPQISPALLMRQKIVENLYEDRSIKVVEFYGRVLDWHMKWTDQARSMFHINCFRNRLMAKIRGIVKRIA
jgi:Acetyltransferase (GNAT) domain